MARIILCPRCEQPIQIPAGAEGLEILCPHPRCMNRFLLSNATSEEPVTTLSRSGPGIIPPLVNSELDREVGGKTRCCPACGTVTGSDPLTCPKCGHLMLAATGAAGGK